MRGTAHSDECRDRVQNRMATDLGEADRYLKRIRFDSDKPSEIVQ